MDLRLLVRVLWRFRVLIAVGFCIALTLTALSMVRVDLGGSPVVSYRSSETWISSAKLFVTEPGFPWGRRLILPLDEGSTQSSSESDPGRFTGLAVLYATFANSDPVRRIIRSDGKVKGKIAASAVLSGPVGEGVPLPIIEVTATGKTKPGAIARTERVTNALVTFIRRQQRANNIPADERVVLETIERPRTAKLLAGRPKVIPIVVFLGVMGLAIGLAFLLENIRPVPTPAEISSEPATRLRIPA